MPTEGRACFGEQRGTPAGGDPTGDEGVRTEIGHTLERANQNVSPSESVRRFAILDRWFSGEPGDLTRAASCAGREIIEHLCDEIESLYHR